MNVIIFEMIFFLLTCLFIYSFQQTSKTISDLKGYSKTQDLINVKLGISEANPNTRAVYYIDINNDN